MTGSEKKTEDTLKTDELAKHINKAITQAIMSTMIVPIGVKVVLNAEPSIKGTHPEVFYKLKNDLEGFIETIETCLPDLKRSLEKMV